MATYPPRLTVTRAAGSDGEGGGNGKRLWRRAEALLVTSAENAKVKKMKVNWW
jgi:hypothetical protein